MNRKYTALGFLCLAVLVSSARADKVDTYIREQLQARQIPGLSLAITRAGKIIKAGGYGLANVELNVPATTETVFEIGSLTKQFTATLIMLLVEEGKIGLDDKLDKHLSSVPESWSGITLRHLLTHSSGIKNYTGLSGFEVTRHLKADEFVKKIGAYPLNFQPGESYSYCNTGYSLLGFVIEKITGNSYWQMLHARIFLPLGMTNSQSRDLKNVMRNRAAGYERENGQLINRDSDLTDIFSAGAIVSTVLDLAKWEAALNTEKILKRSSLDQMWMPLRLNDGKTYPYGFGWRLEDFNKQTNIGHSGSTSGFSASLQRFPAYKLTVMVLCNSGESGVATALAKGVAEFYLPALAPIVAKEPLAPRLR